MIPLFQHPIVLITASLLTAAFALLGILKFVTKRYFKTEALIVDLMKSLPENSGFKFVFAFPDGVKDIKYDKTSSTTTLSYTIPRSICTAKQSKSESVDKVKVIPIEGRESIMSLQLGAVIAVADEVTSIVLGAIDKTHRFGVSVQLSGESCCGADEYPILVGAVVQFVVRVVKIGKSLATVEMDVLVPNGGNHKKVFSVRHIKYVDMGILWNVFGELVPLFLHFNKFSSRIIAQHSLEELLRLTSKPVSENCQQLVGHHQVLDEKQESEDMLHYIMHVNKHVENFFGSMHGGALACAFQLVVCEFCAKVGKSILVSKFSTYSFSLYSMEISYLRPSKKHLLFTVTITSTSSLDRRPEANSSRIMQLTVSCYTSKHADAQRKLAATAVCKVLWVE